MLIYKDILYPASDNPASEIWLKQDADSEFRKDIRTNIMEVDADAIILRGIDFNPKWDDMFIIAAEDWRNAKAAVQGTMQKLSRAGRRKERRTFERKNRAPRLLAEARPQDIPRRLFRGTDLTRVASNIRKWLDDGNSSLIKSRGMCIHAAYANYFVNYEPDVMREWAMAKRAMVEHRPTHLPQSERAKRRAAIEAKVQAAMERRAKGRRRQKVKKPTLSEFDGQGIVPKPAQKKKKADKPPSPPTPPPEGISPHLWSLRDALEKVLKIDGEKKVVV